MEKQELRKYVWAVQALIVIIGTCLIAAGTIFGVGIWWGAILISFGTALTSATLLSIFQARLEIDPVSLIEHRLNFNQQLRKAGLKAIHLQLGDETIFNAFEHAHTIDLMFVTGRSTLVRHMTKIEKAIKERGCRVRLLICDPGSQVLKIKSLSESLCPGTDLAGEISSVLTLTERVINKLRKDSSPPLAGSLELSFFQMIPTASILIVDNMTARFTSYLPYRTSSESPSYDITAEHDGALFSIFQSTFNDVWNDATPVYREDYSLKLERRPSYKLLKSAAENENQVSPVTTPTE